MKACNAAWCQIGHAHTHSLVGALLEAEAEELPPLGEWTGDGPAHHLLTIAVARQERLRPLARAATKFHSGLPRVGLGEGERDIVRAVDEAVGAVRLGGDVELSAVGVKRREDGV